jgi:hypothetical protein
MEQSIANNPLASHFRQPSIYLKLPSGGTMYSPSVLTIPESGELAVYPMTAIDEISAKTPDALYNGTAMVDIIKSCIPDIKDPWAVSSTDFDAILVAIKAATNGNSMDITTICPECKEVADYGVNLVGLLSGLKAADYNEVLQINELEVKFRPLTYREMNQAALGQFDAQRSFQSIEYEEDMDVRNKKTQEAVRTITELTMKILAQAIEYIKTPTVTVSEYDYLLDFLTHCDKNMYVTLRDHNTKLRESTQIKPLQLKCIHCQHDYEQIFTLNTSDFFA